MKLEVGKFTYQLLLLKNGDGVRVTFPSGKSFLLSYEDTPLLFVGCLGQTKYIIWTSRKGYTGRTDRPAYLHHMVVHRMGLVIPEGMVVDHMKLEVNRIYRARNGELTKTFKAFYNPFKNTASIGSMSDIPLKAVLVKEVTFEWEE